MKNKVKRHVVVQPEDPSIRIIALSRGMNALVDSDVYEEMDKFNWSVHNSPTPGYFYAARLRNGKTFFLHHAIMPTPDGMVIDHINGNGLDNRRCNLRIATQGENCRNQRRRKDSTSGVKGVYWSPIHNQWRVSIQVERKRVHVGLYRTLDEAAEAARVAYLRIHGEFSAFVGAMKEAA